MTNNSTNNYIVFAVASATFIGNLASMNTVPMLTQPLNQNIAHIFPNSKYQANNFDTSLNQILVFTNPTSSYPRKGITITIKVIAKINKTIPRLEKEKY